MANNPSPILSGLLGRAAVALVAVGFAVSTPAPAQSKGAPVKPRLQIFVEAPPAHLHVDGDLGEWDDGRARLLAKIDTVAQIWNHAKRRKWGGPDDLSADLRIAQDANHVYLAGTIHDDHHVPVREGEDLETGDSIEVFFNVKRSEDGEDASAGDRLGKEDVQLFLLPLAGKWFRRPWDRDNPGARPTPTGSELEGMQLQAKRSPADARVYTFEARIPVHNFLPLTEGRVFDRLGFQLAINDRDPGSAVVHYATINGENPTLSTSSYPILRFHRALLSTQDSGIGFDERLTEFLPWGLVGLLVLTTILFFARRAPLAHLEPLHARVVRVLGVVLLLLGLFLPMWWENQKSAREQRLESAVETLERELVPRMEEGTLTSYVGAARDKPLLDLLQGESIRRKQSLSYQFLSEMATETQPRQFGKPPREYPEEGFRVRPYWLPLPAEQPQSFSWKKPLEAGLLYLVVSPVDYGFLESPPPTLGLTYRLRDGTEVTRSKEIGVARVSCDVFGKPNRDMTYVNDAIPEGAAGLSITARGEVAVELVGMTLVPINPDAEPRPLVLGQALGEVETDLRGVYPRDAGFEIQGEGETHRVEIPHGRVRKFDKLWLIYSATYPVLTTSEPAKGQEVCKVKIRFAKGKDKVIALRHQESMFYELSSRNSEDVDASRPVVQAEVSRAGDADKRINVVYGVDLPRDALVRGLEFESDGLYPVRFRSVIFGYERSIAPPEPSDSPLVSAGPGMVKLRADILDAIQGNRVAIYRNGSLVESDLVDTERERHAELPAAVQGALLRDRRKSVEGQLDVGSTRVFRRFIPLGEERGAVLGVFGVDEGFGDRQRFWKLMGMVLCLLSIPFLLLLFNDALAWLSNLRLRLMAVVSVAAVVPMAVMFILLVRTLEGDHEQGMQRTLQRAVRTATDQLRVRQDKLLESAKSHVAYLLKVGQEFRAGTDHDVHKLQARLESAMSSQRDWKGGFMKLEYAPKKGAPKWLTAFTTFDSESDVRLDTPLREKGFYFNQKPFLGARIEEGPMTLSLARPVDSDLLREISANKSTILCTTNGYPLVASGDEPGLMKSGLDPELMRERADVRLAARDSREPVFQRHRVRGSWIAAYDVLRDPEDNPRALLGVMQRDEEAKLTLANERVPVRTFFVVTAGLLLVLSLALASIVTSRITDPIERLEQGAEALRRGEFDVRVDTQEGGQIGRLTETFNNMAQDLRGRIQDLNHLNRGIQELTSGLDLDQVLKSAIAFFSRHSSADRVRVILVDWERDRAELFGEDRREVDRRAPDVATVLSATGPLCIKLAPGSEGGVLAGLFPGYHSVMVLPLGIAGRSRGGILLLFESPHPAPVNLEFLTTIAAQTSAALENARLYHHAVEDLYTGAYVPDYFSRVVGRAVAGAQAAGDSLSLIGIRLVHGQKQEEQLGAEGFGRYMEQIASLLRSEVPAEAQICRSSADAFQILLPDVGREQASRMLDDLGRCLVGSDLDVRGATDLEVACATFPEEGASAEFLFHALESKMRTRVSGPVATTTEGVDAGVVFSSPVMSEVIRIVQKIAPSELTILIDGETGTGKEILANHIHQWSKRAKGPLVKVHCAALSESLLQSELFGHEKGAFTGATERRLGKFEQAEGGSIFLDEIGEVSLDTQVKLLRVLQEREVDRVGGSSPVAVDVRVIAATNRDIKAMVADGTFREDLYYRLQGMVVTVPPLRERKSEIPALLEVFRREAVAADHTSVRGFSTDAMDEIFRREWPGNIRELRNAAFRAMVLAGEGTMELSHLMGVLPHAGATRDDLPGSPAVTDPPGSSETPADPRADVVPSPDLPKLVLPRAAASLSPRLQTLWNLVRDRGSLSNQEYVAVARVSPRTGLRDLNELLERGLIERVGRRRGARYRLRGVRNTPILDGE